MSGAPKETDPAVIAQVTPEMIEAVKAKAVDGKITCPVLRALAEDLRITYKVAGAAADAAGVRVKDCSLGCF